MYIIYEYNPILNSDIELCSGNTLEEAITKFMPIKHNHNHYFIKEISPAVKGMPGESIQGTYKAHKNVC